jgi:hypothetical protein
MTYWLNIHDPEPIGHDNDYKVFLKESHENTARHLIKDQVYCSPIVKVIKWE